MATAIDYALMAGAAYISNRDPKNQFPTPPGWLAFAHVPNNPAYPMFTGASGFEAVSFQNATNPNEIVISFAGTDSSSALGDFIYGNIPLASGISVNGADQLVDAVEYYLTVKASVPAGTPITITGHSLGGALAALVGVFFGETAYTFDQVPAYLTATSGPAKLLYDALIAKGHTATELTVLGNYVAAMDGTNPTPAATDTYANRAANITNINVQGEVAGLIPTSRIGNSVDIVQQNNMLFPQSDLHSQALLTTFLQSNQTAAPNKGLNDVTFKLPDLLKMIFDKNLFATDPLNKRDPVENFLERLVKHQAGVQPDPVTGSAAITADAMITRFTTDLWKLAQDGGLTMNDWGLSGGNYNVSRALIAFAMEKYYSEQTGSVGAGATLFQDVSGGIQFDTAAIVAAGKTIMDAKGFAQYFQQYLTQVAPDLGAGAVQFTAAEQHLITAMLPQLRDWYVQAGATGMTATDTLNRGAFMLGGTGADTLTGGAGTDLLVGNAGDDLLQGGKGNDTLLGGTGNDTYQYTNGGTNQDGLDTILDSDGQGRIIIDNAPPLAGGAQFGDARVHRDASGHTYTDVGRGTVIDGNIFVQNWQAGNLGLNMTGPAADALPPVTITGTANADIIDLGVTNITDDVIDAGAGQDYVMAGYGNDTIIGGAGNDALDGFGGNDRLYADNYISVADAITLGNTQAGTGLRGDALSGDDGNDTLAGSNGNDILSGGAGADLLIGGAGNDYIFGDTDWAAGTGDTWGVVNNVLVGGAGGIANWSGDNSDVIYAGAGDDHVWGELGNDVILGEGGADLLVGGSGNDIILGGDNNDIIYGDLADSANFAAAPGNDYLDGGTGDDVIYGNEGDDILIGGTGNDTLNGGVGQDTYLYNLGDGNDQIRDTIVAGETNKLLFGAGITLNSLKLSIGANGYMLTLGDGSTIELMSGASGTLNAQRNYTFDPQHTDIQELQFADGSSIGWADFLKRGLDQHGLLPGTVLGSDNGDRLSGANSILVGGAGSDTYTFQIGDGVVHVRDVINSGDTNTLRLGAGITSSNIQLHLGSLMLDMGNGDAVHIDNFDQNDVFYSSTIQRFEFADGTILTTDELLARGFDLNGTAGGDTITGTNTTDRINGLGGNDTLIGGEGDDTLSGGTGNDVLIGGIGSDTYVFNRGDGQDIIADGGDPSIVSGQIGNVDTLQFGADILQSDVTIRRTPAGELEFSIAGSTDTLTISGWYTADADANRIERIVFGDGSMLTPIDFENLPITGTAGDDIIDGTPAAETILGMGGNDALNGGDGNDTLDGGTGNDVLNGGAGNDTLIGGGGQDTYVMGFGMGMDAVIDTSMQGGIIQLNSALAFTDLAVTRQGDDLLLQIVGGSNEGMMLKGYYANPLATWTIRDTNNNTTTPQAILDTAPSASVVSQLESAFITNSKRQEVNSLLAGGYTAQADGSFYRSTQNDPISAYFYSKDWIMTWYDQPQTTETTYQNWRTPYSGYSIYNETATINVVNTSTDAAVVDVRSGGSWSQTITMATRSVAWENSKTRDGYHRRIDYTTTWSQLYPTNVISSYWGFGYANWPSNLISVRYHPNTTIALGHLSSSSSIQPIGGAYPSSIQVSVYDYQHTYDIQKINLGASDHTVYANWYTVVNAGTGNDTISGAGFVSASSGNITTNYCRTVYTGSGNDFIYGANFTQGSAGNDTIFTYGGSNIVLDHNTLGQVLIGNLNYIPYDRWIDYSGYDPQNDLIVAFDPGISSSDLRFAWGQVTANFERNLVQPSTYKTINISWGTNQSVQVISQTRFQFVDGSYCSYAVDGHGGSSMKVYDAQGRLASDFWQQSQGSQFGSDSYHADGSGYGEWHNADGSYATYTQAADGSYTEFNYDAAGKLTFDYWWKPDNSWGQDYFNADGSGSGENHSADGSHSNYTNDGLGVVTTNFFDSSNLALGHNISTTDAQGNVISTVYDANNVVLGVATGSLAQQVHPSGASAIQFAASISAANLAVSQNSLGDFVISYNNGASSLVVPAQSAISAPVVASFTNGANWQFVNASGNPYTYAAGSGVVYIANPSAVQFGAGITPGMVTLGLGSLMLRVGNGGDVLHIEGFNANDALAPNAIQSFSFADGTMLTYDQMLGRGFDLYGTGGNDTLSGTNLTDRMVGGAGDDVLNGGAGDDVLEGGAGNDTLIGGSGNDTYHFNLGDGADVIVDGTEGGISSNTLVLGAGITASMITPIIDANGMVTLDFGNTDSVQINQLGNLSVQHIQFADGSVVLTESLLSVAPVAVDDMIAATEGAGAVVISQAQLLANDTASNGNTLSVAHFDAVSANGNAVVQDTSGNLVLDIGSRYQSLGVGQTATDRFTYTITNAAGLTSTAAVNVTITGTNDAPVTTVDTAAVQEDLSITATGNVLMNDSDVDQGTVLSVANAGVFVGQFGQLTLQSDGSYTYALDNASLSVQSLAQGQVVTETFAYQATDGITSTPSILTVSITGTNDATVTTVDAAAVQEDLSITATGNVLTNDSDVDQGTVLAVANAGVFTGQFGQLTLNADGSYSYALDNALLGVQSLAQGQVVTETFAYQATDGITSTPSTLTVTITGTNDAPVVVADNAGVMEVLPMPACSPGSLDNSPCRPTAATATRWITLCSACNRWLKVKWSPRPSPIKPTTALPPRHPHSL
ncbi:MAG: hypothetical protein FD121_1427 [Gallionellaceae bacterium]|nr:MAG: hypothetical protein FD121_1427 [Gallionellaceae bacterium]